MFSFFKKENKEFEKELEIINERISAYDQRLDKLIVTVDNSIRFGDPYERLLEDCKININAVENRTIDINVDLEKIKDNLKDENKKTENILKRLDILIDDFNVFTGYHKKFVGYVLTDLTELVKKTKSTKKTKRR